MGNNPHVHVTGEGRVPFIDARGIAAVAAQVLIVRNGHAGQAYPPMGSEPLTNAEALAVITRETGRPVALVSFYQG